MGLAVAYIPYFISERNESIIVSYPITMTLYCYRPEEVLTMGTIVLAKRFEPALESQYVLDHFKNEPGSFII